MAGSLAQFLGALTGVLRAAGLDGFARLVSAIDATARVEPAAAPARLAACRFWDEALRVAHGPLAAPVGVLGPSLSWTQNPNYRRQPPDPGFLDHYGYAVIARPGDGPPALVTEPRVALGVLLLGPHTHYPVHAHPAVEVYVTLTGGEWWRDDGPWRQQPAGAAVYHAPNVRHAMRAGAEPLLAVYVWSGDLATHARLVS